MDPLIHINVSYHELYIHREVPYKPAEVTLNSGQCR